jgi:hypothetical protein
MLFLGLIIASLDSLVRSLYQCRAIQITIN